MPVFPPVTVEVSFTTDPGQTPVWVDISSYVIEFHTRRGRQFELDRYEAGTAKLILDNTDRRFEGGYTGGAYYPNIRPMKKIRISALVAPTTYRVFTGYVERWLPSWGVPDQATVLVDCVDGLSPLSTYEVSTSFPQQLSGARILAVLNALGIVVPGESSIDAGKSTIQASTLAGVSALDHIRLVADSELGYFFYSAAGWPTFHDRHKRLKAPFSGSSSLWDNVSSLINIPDSVLADFGQDLIRNRWKVTRAGGVLQEAADQVSESRYFSRTGTRTPLITSDTEAADMAGFLKWRYSAPTLRVNAIEINVGALYGTGVADRVLAREFGDRIEVKWQPPGASGAIDGQYHIDAISHDVGPGPVWVSTFGLTPAETTAYLVLDDATNGRLDSNALAY